MAASPVMLSTMTDQPLTSAPPPAATDAPDEPAHAGADARLSLPLDNASVAELPLDNASDAEPDESDAPPTPPPTPRPNSHRRPARDIGAFAHFLGQQLFGQARRRARNQSAKSGAGKGAPKEVEGSAHPEPESPFVLHVPPTPPPELADDDPAALSDAPDAPAHQSVFVTAEPQPQTSGRLDTRPDRPEPDVYDVDSGPLPPAVPMHDDSRSPSPPASPRPPPLETEFSLPEILDSSCLSPIESPPSRPRRWRTSPISTTATQGPTTVATTPRARRKHSKKAAADDSTTAAPETPSLVINTPTDATTPMSLPDSASASPFPSQSPSHAQQGLPPVLRSPRSLLHALIPSPAAQTIRMELLLLHAAPTRDALADAAWNGCAPTTRAQVWRLLLGVEPLHFSQRAAALDNLRKRYADYRQALYAPEGEVLFDARSSSCSAIIAPDGEEGDGDDGVEEGTVIVPTGDAGRGEADGEVASTSIGSSTASDSPSLSAASSGSSNSSPNRRRCVKYSSLSARTLRQIEMDLPRTHPRIAIFHTAEVRGAMRRILYIFGMLHPHFNYVQGMNEVLTPMLVVFFSGLLDAAAETDGRGSERGVDAFLARTRLDDAVSAAQLADAEADAFWTFSSLVATIDDNFAPDQPGVLRRVARLEEIVRLVEPGLSAHLRRNGNLFFQFSLRWMNCLLMRELPFRLVVKLWDALLGQEHGFADLHVYVCAALVSRFGDELYRHDFEGCMLFLQRLPTAHWDVSDIDLLLSQAIIWRRTLGLESLAPSTPAEGSAPVPVPVPVPAPS